MILITGATGTVGSEVLRLLTATGAPVRAMTRNPARLRSPYALDVVRADFDDPASLRRATAGAEAVFLLTAPAAPTPRHDLALLDAARAAGTSRIVKLSAIGTGETDDHGRTVGAWHQLAEQAVQASGLAWTLLRPSLFASNTLHWADPVKAGTPVPNLTGHATQGVIDPRDVAAVAAEALTSPTTHTGQTYTLTGPDLLSVPDQAAQLADLLGHPVTTADVTPEAARSQLLASGMNPAAVDTALTGITWARAGHNALLTDDVATILGRPPTSFAAWARDHLDSFRQNRPG
jgi:uncharacterized protein YbjT (DUF2867 family)